MSAAESDAQQQEIIRLKNELQQKTDENLRFQKRLDKALEKQVVMQEYCDGYKQQIADLKAKNTTENKNWQIRLDMQTSRVRHLETQLKEHLQAAEENNKLRAQLYDPTHKQQPAITTGSQSNFFVKPSSTKRGQGRPAASTTQRHTTTVRTDLGK